MKRPQTKFHARTMRESQVVRLKKSQNLSIGQTFSASQFFLLNIDILLKLQQPMLIWFSTFSCNSVTKVSLLRFLA